MSETRELIERLVKIPVQIKDKQIELISITDQLTILDREIEQIEAEIKGEVSKDESLTNDTRRKAAIREKLDARQDYKDKVGMRQVTQTAVRLEQINLGFLRDQFTACQSIALIQAPKSIQVNLGGL